MGTLYLVSTPIGNLEDITLRALRVLRQVRLIAAEDTRRARLLLRRYEIETPVTSYFEGNKLVKLNAVLEALAAGDVALISEAGTPGLSDPGYELVRAAIASGYPVVPVPGPSAPIVALVASGLPTDHFVFLGFLPRRAAQRRALLERVRALPWTLVAFEAPHRLAEALADLASVLGEERALVLCREMTKQFEETWRGTIGQARARFANEAPRGEFTLVIAGAAPEGPWQPTEVRAALEERLAEGLSLAQAAQEVATLAGWSRKAVYRLALGESSRSGPADGG